MEKAGSPPQAHGPGYPAVWGLEGASSPPHCQNCPPRRCSQASPQPTPSISPQSTLPSDHYFPTALGCVPFPNKVTCFSIKQTRETQELKLSLVQILESTRTQVGPPDLSDNRYGETKWLISEDRRPGLTTRQMPPFKDTDASST